MTSLKVLDSDARPQAVSPLFTRVPSELRLLIYKFVFVGCQAKVYFNQVFNGGEYVDDRGKRRRWMVYGREQCCYHHFEGGFGLLTTCRIIYIEAFQAYWSEAILAVQCYSPHMIYTYLPAMIKASLRHLRNLNLPTERGVWPTRDDPDWIPTLLGQFPKLVSCEFANQNYANDELAAWKHMANFWLRVPDHENPSDFYQGVGRFNLKSRESPPAYLERTMGIKPSCSVIILSRATGGWPPDRLKSKKYRVSPIHMYVPYTK